MHSPRHLWMLGMLPLACAAPSSNDPSVEDAKATAASALLEGELPNVESGEYSGSGYHKRPLIEHGGRRLLWAKDHDGGDQEWFDVTDADIDPETFQFGIGKDTIPSIDDPVFLEYDDPQLEEAGVTLETEVLGIAIDGIARAYPVDTMARHEVVNDVFGDTAYAVLW